MENSNNVAKVLFDPGWNDPPNLTYNAQQSTPSRPRNFLNKRVAFPLIGSVNISPQPSANLPPMPTAVPLAPPIPLTSTPFNDADEISYVDSENALQEVKTILMKILDDSSELASKSNDIRRRINVMEEMWSSGKLNQRIHGQMLTLCFALRDNEPSKADDIHRALMVDHVSSVGTWMPAVKQLIRNSIARCELLEIDKE